MKFLRFLGQEEELGCDVALTSAPVKLTLYETPYCPYCTRVRKAAKDLGISLESVDVGRSQKSYQLLLDKFGRGTVPVLAIETIDGVKYLPESRKIIEYLRKLQASISPRV